MCVKGIQSRCADDVLYAASGCRLPSARLTVPSLRPHSISTPLFGTGARQAGTWSGSRDANVPGLRTPLPRRITAQAVPAFLQLAGFSHRNRSLRADGRTTRCLLIARGTCFCGRCHPPPCKSPAPMWFFDFAPANSPFEALSLRPPQAPGHWSLPTATRHLKTRAWPAMRCRPDAGMHAGEPWRIPETCLASPRLGRQRT